MTITCGVCPRHRLVVSDVGRIEMFSNFYDMSCIVQGRADAAGFSVRRLLSGQPSTHARTSNEHGWFSPDKHQLPQQAASREERRAHVCPAPNNTAYTLLISTTTFTTDYSPFSYYHAFAQQVYLSGDPTCCFGFGICAVVRHLLPQIPDISDLLTPESRRVVNLRLLDCS